MSHGVPDMGMPSKERSAILDELYQQLKDIDSINFREQRNNISRVLWEQKQGSGSENTLGQQLECLDSLSSIQKQLQNSIRSTVNIISRPMLGRSLNIFDLPDEILMKISTLAKGWKPDERCFRHGCPDREGVSSIKNLRLTSRRFCNASSHLLLHATSVELTPSSLSRLDSISRHPQVQKVVRGVRVDLHYFDAMLAQDFYDFAEYAADKMSKATDSLEMMLPPTPNSKKSREDIIEAVRVGRVVQTTWEGIAAGIPDDSINSEDLNFRMVLRRAHLEYSRLFMDQQALLKDGKFEVAVAAAISRMPIATRLEVKDEMYKKAGEIDYFDYGEEPLTQRLLLPINFDAARYYQLAGPPSGLLSTSSVAIYNAGVSLTHLHIGVSPLQDYTAFASTGPTLRALTASAQCLKEFSFVCRGLDANLFPIRSKNDIDGLKKFLMALLDTASLTEISINLDSLWEDGIQSSFDFGSAIHFRTWPILESFHTSTLPLHLAELEQFVNHLPHALRYMELKATRLLSGTWAEALDALKQQSGKGWSIDVPSGGECDTMSEEENQAIFGSSYETWDDDSLANKYLHGILEENPLR